MSYQAQCAFCIVCFKDEGELLPLHKGGKPPYSFICPSCVRRLRDQNKRMLAMLKDLQYTIPNCDCGDDIETELCQDQKEFNPIDYQSTKVCAYCAEEKPKHTNDCELAALIREVEKGAEG